MKKALLLGAMESVSKRGACASEKLPSSSPNRRVVTSFRLVSTRRNTQIRRIVCRFSPKRPLIFPASCFQAHIVVYDNALNFHQSFCSKADAQSFLKALAFVGVNENVAVYLCTLPEGAKEDDSFTIVHILNPSPELVASEDAMSDPKVVPGVMAHDIVLKQTTTYGVRNKMERKILAFVPNINQNAQALDNDGIKFLWSLRAYCEVRVYLHRALSIPKVYRSCFLSLQDARFTLVALQWRFSMLKTAFNSRGMAGRSSREVMLSSRLACHPFSERNVFLGSTFTGTTV